MAEVTEAVPTGSVRSVRPVHKDQGRFIRKRPGKRPAGPEPESGGADEAAGESVPTEHIDTRA